MGPTCPAAIPTEPATEDSATSAMSRSIKLPTQSALITRLHDPEAYPHPVEHVECVETHISWVLLTGKYAYKVKKPVALGFLDFSTLPLRHSACLEELRLNRRFAPQLYVDVAPIAGPIDCATVCGAGEIVEYAVRMHQFEQSDQLDRLLDAGGWRKLISCEPRNALRASTKEHLAWTRTAATARRRRSNIRWRKRCAR